MADNDPFKRSANLLGGPAADAVVITPHATDDLPQATKALYVGGAGDIVLRTVAGQADVTFSSVPAGAILPVRVRAVRVAGTTATNIVGLI